MELSTRLALRTGALFAGLCLVALPASQQGLGSASFPLRVEVGPECDVSISEAGAGSGQAEERYRWISGTLGVRYRVRTGAAGGGGAIHLRLGGLGDAAAVAYNVSVNGIGAAVAGDEPLAATGAVEVPVVSFGPNQHTTSRGDTASVAWRVRYPAAQDRVPVPTPQVRCTVH
jgi:hypothetical protein